MRRITCVNARLVGCSLAAIVFLGESCRAQCDAYAVETFQGPFCQFTGFAGPVPQAINDNGTIVGFFLNCSDNERAFQWTAGPTFATLPNTPGFYSARAYDLNSSNQIVGRSVLVRNSPISDGFLFQNGSYLDLGDLMNSTEVEPTGINDATQICGYTNNSSTGPLRAFLWERGKIRALELPIGKHARGRAIDNHSNIVGWMGDLPTFTAFLWIDGNVINIGIPEGSFASEALAISDTGHIAGQHYIEIEPGIYRSRGFHWRNGVFTDLGLLPGYDRAFVTGVNDRGEIVGWCQATGQFSAPFIWRDGVMTDLRTLVDLPPNTILGGAWDINNQGQIAATGYSPPPNGNAEDFGYRLTPRSKVLGDYDCNHLVDEADLLGVIERWGPSNGPADFNDDGLVNVPDLLTVIVNWTP